MTTRQPGKHALFSIAVYALTSILVLPRAAAAENRIEELIERKNTIAEDIFGPLDNPVPASIREYLADLRENLLDEAAKKPAAGSNAYDFGVRFCNGLISACDEREIMAARLRNNAPSNATGKPITRKDHPNWADYSRERAEARATTHDNKLETAFARNTKLQWSQRSEQLRKALDASYAQFREAARQPVAVKHDEALQLKAKREELAAHTFPVPVPDPAATAVSAVDQRAQSDNPQEPGKPELPEIQPLWAPYQAGLKAVGADRDKKLANLDNIYLLNLDKMKKERAEAVDLDGALAVKAEMDRLGAHQPPSDEQRNAMPPALRALRTAYDAALKGYWDEAARGDEALRQKYLMDLEGLQKRITMTGNLQKALLVKAERDRLMAGPSNPQAAPITPEVKVAPVPVPEAVPVPPVIGSTPMKIGTARFADATKERPFENSLGMKFVPVPIIGGPSAGQRVLFSIWETRAQDYAALLDSKRTKGARVSSSQGPTHPKTSVTWDEAQAFCAWLTEHERTAGRLGTTESYRLPTDHEWSCALGIGAREDPAKTPREKNGKIADVFPWGTGFPPSKAKVGNYADAALHAQSPKDPWIEGYTDGYATSAPVGTFPPNDYGICDLGGNAWEWCGDLFEPGRSDRVLRGASWKDIGRIDLLSSHRNPHAPTHRTINVGFRCVIGASAR